MASYARGLPGPVGRGASLAQERKVGSVTYQEVVRSTSRARAPAACRRLVALGPRGRRRHLRGLLRLEPRSADRRVRRARHRDRVHHDHVHRLCYSIAEMSPALPHTGGAYSFGRSAMGPWGGSSPGSPRMHGVRRHPGGRGGRDRLLHERHHDRAVRPRHPAPDLVADRVRDLRRAEHRGSRRRCGSRW